MPSPTSTTVPTLRVSAPLVERVDRGPDDADDLVGTNGHRMDLLEGARDELAPQALEAAADAAVDQAVADPDDEAAEQARDRSPTVSSTFPPVIFSSRAVSCLSSPCSSGEALVAVAWTIPLRWSSRRRNSAATLGRSLDPAAPDHEQDQVEDGRAHDDLPRPFVTASTRGSRSGSPGCATRSATAGSASDRRRPRRARAARRRPCRHGAAISKAASA